MPSLADSMESLTQEQDKLVMMAPSNHPKTKLWLLEIRGWIQKRKKKLKSHLSKKRDKNIPEEPQGSRRTHRRIKTKRNEQVHILQIRAITLKAPV